MSFILDALKKSEQERERQQQPAVVDIPYGRRNRRQPLWLLIVIGLLLLNCALLLLMWWRSDTQPPPAPAAAATSAPAAASSQSAAPVTTPSITPPRPAEVRPLAAEASEPEVTDETAATLADETPPPGPALVRPSGGLERAIAQQEALANNLKSGRNSIVTSNNRAPADNVPTLDSLGGNGALNLPAMRLDVHVYSSVATERFAFINSHKYLEGQTLSEGPMLEKITQDGVILNYRGQRFLVPRQ